MKACLLVVFSLVFGVSTSPAFPKYQSNYVEGIVGGDPATIEEFPWIVSIRYKGQHRCGASIIAANRILTAAHCTKGLEPKTLSIRAGSTYHEVGGQLIDVISVINHPEYNPKTFENDVSVMWLASWLNTTYPAVAVVPMAFEDDPFNSTYNTNALVAGWGFMKEGAYENSPDLRSVAVPIVDQLECEYLYGGSIREGMICAGFPEGGRDACQNDSGGPLTIDGVLVGVVSWGRGCARPNLPGVFASVAFYHKWITTNMY